MINFHLCLICSSCISSYQVGTILIFDSPMFAILDRRASQQPMLTTEVRKIVVKKNKNSWKIFRKILIDDVSNLKKNGISLLGNFFLFR